MGGARRPLCRWREGAGRTLALVPREEAPVCQHPGFTPGGSSSAARGGALLGPRCPVPPLAVSPLTFPVGKIGTECPRHFQGPPSLPDRTIAGQGPFCPCQASLHHGMLIRLRPQSTPTEQVHIGRLTLHPPRAGWLTLRTHGGRTGPAVWREQVGAPRTPLRATCTIPASASRPLRRHERAPGRLPGAGPVCSRPEEHGDAPFVTRDFALCPRPRPPPSVSASSSLIPASARCDSN